MNAVLLLVAFVRFSTEHDGRQIGVEGLSNPGTFLQTRQHQRQRDQQRLTKTTATTPQFLSMENRQTADGSDGTGNLPRPPPPKTFLRSSIAAAVVVFLVGCFTPVAMASDVKRFPSNVLVSDAGGSTPPIEIADLVKSLRPATESRPQIPFPTNEALQKAAEAAASATTRSSAAQSANPFSKKQANTVPQENLLRENPYSLPALISLESSPKNRGALSPDRPYNGSDVLVVQVWTDRPPTATEDNTNSETTAALVPKRIGGAKIPIGAVVGGFPVRVSLGPQNALAETALSTSGKSDTADGFREWKGYLSSKSLWVRAAVCRGSETNSASKDPTVEPFPNPSSCPSDYPIPVLEGLGFSKWIDLPPVAKTETTEPRASSNAGGLRAPVSLVLAAPR